MYVHQRHGQTDGQTTFSWQYGVAHVRASRGKNVALSSRRFWCRRLLCLDRSNEVCTYVNQLKGQSVLSLRYFTRDEAIIATAVVH